MTLLNHTYVTFYILKNTKGTTASSADIINITQSQSFVLSCFYRVIGISRLSLSFSSRGRSAAMKDFTRF